MSARETFAIEAQGSIIRWEKPKIRKCFGRWPLKKTLAVISSEMAIAINKKHCFDC